MNQNLTQWLPLLVTCIAGFFALIQIRSNNITNARIKWLENFRHLIADFFSECTMVQIKEGLYKGINERGEIVEIPEAAKKYQDKINETMAEHLQTIELKHDLVKLNLNPKEDLHLKFESIFDTYVLLLNKIPSCKRIKEFDALVRTLEAHSDTLLLLTRYIVKLEWEKTKRSYVSKKYYMTFGGGNKILSEALNLKIKPERCAEE